MNNNPYSSPYVNCRLFRTMHPITTIIMEVMGIMQVQEQVTETRAITTILTNSNLIMVLMAPLMDSTVKMATPITTNLTRMQLIAVLV